MKKIFVLLIRLIITSSIFAQGFTNHGAKINIASGVVVTVGDLTNETAGDDGMIYLDGTLQVRGNITNSSDGHLFGDIESSPDGQVILSGQNKNIGGQTEIYFENLTVNDARTMQINANVFGDLTLNGVLDLNSNVLTISNGQSSAINYTSGNIKSETTENDGLGIVTWKIGNNTGTYSVPFGSAQSTENDLNISLNITNAGSSANGYINFATYPTNGQNSPLPDDVISLNNFDALAIADRFWLIQPVYSTNPDFSIEISFLDEDLDTTSNIYLNPDSLAIIRYNPDEDTWSDLKIPSVTNGNKITANISGTDVYKWFSIAGEQADTQNIEIIIPNGITPNNDNYNDTWVIEGCENCKVYIYNRWGDKVYYSENYDNTWDGGKNPSGAYYYVIITPSNKIIKGVVNILR